MTYHARIYDLTTGRFLINFNVQSRDLHEAENTAIYQAALTLHCRPHDMEVRHLHQCHEQNVENIGIWLR